MENIKVGIEDPAIRSGSLSELVSDEAVDEGFRDKEGVIVSVCEDAT